MKRLNYKKGIGPLVIILIVAIVLAIGGGVYYANHKTKTSGEAQVQTSTDINTNVSTEASSGTLRNLLAMGKNLMCTFDETTATSSVTGTMYLSGTMMGGDFTMSGGTSGSVTSHMIRNGDIVYAWSGSQGAKMMMSNMMNTSTQSKNNVNLDQKVNYKCSNWTPDSSKFSVPTNVNFTDISAAVNANAGASVSSQCSACASLSGTAKSQCLLALHC